MPTTPAQMFHMLRRQVKRPLRKPLIAFTPKSLLRHKLAISTLEDLANGTFQPVMSEIDPLDPERVSRVVLCSGKVYYDLLETTPRRSRRRRRDRAPRAAVSVSGTGTGAGDCAVQESERRRVVSGRTDEPGRVVCEPAPHASRDSAITAKTCICRMRDVKRRQRRRPVTCNCTSSNRRVSSKMRCTVDVDAENTKKDDRVTLEIKAPSFPESIADGTVAAWHKQPGEAGEARRGARRDRDRQGRARNRRAGRWNVAADRQRASATSCCRRKSSGCSPKVRRARRRQKPPSNRRRQPNRLRKRAAAADREPTSVSPAARKLAAEQGVALTRVDGTGKDGRVTKEDVLRAAAQKPQRASAPAGCDRDAAESRRADRTSAPNAACR